MMKEQRSSTRLILFAVGLLLAAGITAAAAAEEPQVPTDIRIMQRIIRTALEEVEAPELPEILKGEEGGSLLTVTGERKRRQYDVFLSHARTGALSIRDISGFYMAGYGYLFTIDVGSPGSRWLFGIEEGLFHIYETAERLAAVVRSREQAERTAEEQEQAEEEAQRQEERRQALEAWRDEYRERAIEALQEVLATYGSTLKRAADEEQITFIVDLDSGEQEENVSLTVRKGEIGPPDHLQRTLGAIRVGHASAGSEKLQQQIRIMGEIIDTALEPEETEAAAITFSATSWFGGEADPVYIEGYGVIFRKNAMMRQLSLESAAAPPPPPPAPGDTTLRVEVEERAKQAAEKYRARGVRQREESQENYRKHLDELKRRTAGLLVDYGPTLTGLDPGEWVGIHYNVGSAGSVLAGGVKDFLVQARMRDIREAAGRGEGGAEWLLGRLVTNEAPSGEERDQR
ncbi:MAG: hypothetical protein R6W82_09730 [bacterium]